MTRKITKAVCEIEAGLRDKLMLGNLESQRDWGHAKDYMMGAWSMLQQDSPEDYVLATGQSHSVREFVERAFQCVGKTIIWEGQGIKEQGRDKISGDVLVEVSADLFRPKEVNHLLGDATKAKKNLNWQPQVSFEEMIEEMIAADRISNQYLKPHAA